jgi:hypothetical protein
MGSVNVVIMKKWSCGLVALFPFSAWAVGGIGGFVPPSRPLPPPPASVPQRSSLEVCTQGPLVRLVGRDLTQDTVQIQSKQLKFAGVPAAKATRSLALYGIKALDQQGLITAAKGLVKPGMAAWAIGTTAYAGIKAPDDKKYDTLIKHGAVTAGVALGTIVGFARFSHPHPSDIKLAREFILKNLQQSEHKLKPTIEKYLKNTGAILNPYKLRDIDQVMREHVIAVGKESRAALAKWEDPAVRALGQLLRRSETEQLTRKEMNQLARGLIGPLEKLGKSVTVPDLEKSVTDLVAKVGGTDQLPADIKAFLQEPHHHGPSELPHNHVNDHPHTHDHDLDHPKAHPSNHDHAHGHSHDHAHVHGHAGHGHDHGIELHLPNFEAGERLITKLRELEKIHGPFVKTHSMFDALVTPPAPHTGGQILSELNDLSILGLFPILGGVVGGLVGDTALTLKYAKQPDQQPNIGVNLENSLKEAAYQYLANIVLCNVGAGGAIYALEAIGRIAPKNMALLSDVSRNQLARVTAMALGVGGVGMLGGGAAANFVGQTVVEPVTEGIKGGSSQGFAKLDKNIELMRQAWNSGGYKGVVKQLNRERTAEASDAGLHLDDVAAVGSVAGAKIIEPLIPFLYATSGYRAGIGYRNGEKPVTPDRNPFRSPLPPAAPAWRTNIVPSRPIAPTPPDSGSRIK